jgi:precorrin-6B C5,15-methyltransferase / cobalt-precorrin-6B C5,C15-methyltransferase
VLAKRGYLTIVGMGVSPAMLPEQARTVIDSADLLIGGRRLLAWFPGHAGETLVLGRDPGRVLKDLEKKLPGCRVVLLASGDPNFFGIAALAYRSLGTQRVRVLPQVTAFQAAFARMREPWDDAVFISVHGRNISCLNRIVNGTGTFVVYCDATNTPARVAGYLTGIDTGLGRCRTWVFDRLGTPDEQVHRGLLKKFLQRACSPLSMLVIIKETPPPARTLGIDDDLFVHQRGMITRRDIRVLSLARLRLGDARVLWDIGAGSGSISVEAAAHYPGLQVYAVEQDEARYRELAENIAAFKVPSVTAVHGAAPAALKALPDPDAVFIGGSDARLSAILRAVRPRLSPGGHVVINCVLPDTLSEVSAWLHRHRWRYDVTAVQLSRLSPEKKPPIFRAQNPVCIVHAHTDDPGSSGRSAAPMRARAQRRM